ncbi:hypothetical protein PTT_16971 [Pyrenophora teres f. teres 0-1]|uniref:Uncharacterized protein n=1 Tax=Pyrenophora teres f. teres (strain 0-1) TaxID=861557 RepID=E3S3D7_PYRTT|nr:hypothetical protein PTT_16971 [Pyrenophora teres f. teres 0-1]KAE8850709.1 hypothetical protein PTNB85_01125 [Pyrenophora teres f. teres]
MPPIRTQKKHTSPPRGIPSLEAFGFRPIPKGDALVTAAVRAAVPASALPSPPSSSASNSNSHVDVVSQQALSTSQSVPAVQQVAKPKPRLPRPLVQGERNVVITDSRRDWDGRYYRVIGTSTRKIKFGYACKLADNHINDILSLGPKVCKILTDFEFDYKDVDYDAHNDAQGITPAALLTFLEASPSLKRISLPGANLNDDALIGCLAWCDKLTHLEITGSNITAKSFLGAAENPDWAPGLKKLRVPQGNTKYMQAMRVLGKTRPELTIELVTYREEKKHGSFYLVVRVEKYRKGRKVTVWQGW